MTLLVQDLDVRVFNTTTGELLRALTINPNKRYQGTGRPPAHNPADPDVRIVTLDGTLLRQLTLDTSRRYQPSGLPRQKVSEGSDVPR